MATDYLSSLNIGSGLNTTEIIDSLVAAERAPRENIINEAKEERTVAISSLGQIKNEFSAFETSLGTHDSQTGLNAFQTGNALDLEITDKSLATDFSSQITITSLARAHTLVFDDFASETAAIGTGTMSFAFGRWNGDGSFTANANRSGVDIDITADNATINGLRDAINDANIGLTASILKTGSASYALMIKSREGLDHAMQISTVEDPADSGLNDFAYGAVDANVETVSAADATLTLDGASITRDSNQIDDLIDGVSLTLKSETAQAETIGARYDVDAAFSTMQDIVSEINALHDTLSTLSQRGTNGQNAGPLAGDPLVRALKSQLRGYTTTPINGFGANARYLAEFGVQTQRDGSVTIDETAFKAAVNADPDGFAAIVHSRVTTDSGQVSASITGSQYKAGVYAFDIMDDGSATLDGVSMTRSADRFSIQEGDAAGLRVDITGNGADTNIYIGTSLLDSLLDFADSVIGTNSQIAAKLQSYNDDLTDYDTQLAELDTRIAAVRSRYVTQFSAMERAVTALKETGTGLENMMDAWRASLDS